jgi:hypothetical protein
MQSQFECISQPDIDAAVALISDPDVSAAYLARPLSTLDADLADARARHGVGLVNESFGRTARHGIEELELESGCGVVSFEAYFTTLASLDAAYAQAHREAGVFYVQSAGNDGAQVDGPADSLDCWTAFSAHVLVGAYGSGGAHTSFTNFGACVDVYAPGEGVVTPLPGDWLMPLDGTSFSAPLVVRLLSLTAPTPFDPDSARAALVARREPNRNILGTVFPKELLYNPGKDAYLGALTAAMPGAALRPVIDRFAAAPLRHALWPLDWVRRRAGRSPAAR